MKRMLSILLVLIFAAGCVHPAIKPRAGTIKSGCRIVIVPVEPPPLSVPPYVSSDGLFSDPGLLLSLSCVVGPASSTGQGLAVLSGILLFVELPEATRRAAKVSHGLEEMLSREKVWCPTVVLGQCALELLAASSGREVVIVTNYQRLVAVTSREMTWHMQNWFVPIADWYNQTKTPFPYAEPQVGRGDYVLEVGISNYELGADRLILQVLVKLVDPVDGKVLGRARKLGMPSAGRMENLFTEDGKRFKELFVSTGKGLLAKAMKDLDLLPK